ncbi:hypothetical protein I204_06711 [Kwoniella mangroviensis CBS 8886]|uniref:uncharacterized protein n=1 Tax=Kwoniella mangroviensis CBS 8507 TaxID=1296122 RepID=UPI00080CCE8D|nr:uncharacterized protein I203_01316 [Kwoniella mangroviensis CBS 8507]OCF69459.1 hypothetical protein I203_01316 [Kwoniella mangroviensis CBS 8507]OCF72332.1 hypothetical protein I204_06711 [Kwoniella mangroviensis CBS 8886]
MTIQSTEPSSTDALPSGSTHGPSEALHSWNQYTSTFQLSTMEPLESIRHLIFQILIDEISLTLIRVSKHFYDTITPSLYQVVELDKNNTHKVFWGMLIQLKEKVDNPNPSPNQSKTSAESTGKKKEKEKKNWKIGERKLNLLKMIQYITFEDSQSVDKFFKKVKIFDSVNHLNGLKEYQRILTSVKHVRFGKDLVGSSSTDFTKLRRSFFDRITDYGLVDYLEEIMFHAQPLSICLEWPRTWERDERYLDVEDDNDLFEPTLAYAIDDILEELIKHNGKGNKFKFRIHIHSFYFHEAIYILYEFPLDYGMIFDLDDKPGEGTVHDLIHEMEGLKEELKIEFTGVKEGSVKDDDFISRIHTTEEEELYCPCDSVE